MSVCEDVKERLCEFLDGELAQADRAVVESHLQSCTGCREELSALRVASTAVRTLGRRPAPASILAGVRSGLKQQPQTPDVPEEVIRPGPSFWLRRALSVAAVLIVAVLIYVAYIPQHREQRAMSPAKGEAKSALRSATPADSSANQYDAVSKPAAPTPALPATEAVDERLPGRQQAFGEAHEENALADSTLERATALQEKIVATQSPIAPKAELPAPSAPAPVAQGTPPHVAEGSTRPLSKESVADQLKQGWRDLTGAQEAKPADELAQKREEKKEKAISGTDRGQVAKADNAPRSVEMKQPAAPAATARPAEPVTQVAQGELRKQLDLAQPDDGFSNVARARREKEEETARSKSQAVPEKPLVAAKGKGAEDRDVAAAKNEALKLNQQVDTEGNQSADQAERSARQVLMVPLDELNTVASELKQMATASGGELAWQPSIDKTRQMKKDARQMAKSGAALGTEQAVIRVPQARMAELLRATEQYRAKLLLNAEAASKKTAFALDRQQAAGQQVADDTEFVQIVLDIQPQTVPSAAEASHADPAAKQESEKSEAKE